MFNRKANKIYKLIIENERLKDRVFTLEKNARDDEKYNSEKINALRNELNEITQLKESGNLKPCVSKACEICKFHVDSTWSNRIVGCRKDSVCNDFEEV